MEKNNKPIDVSQIKKNEHLVFFRTCAYFDELNKCWRVPVHGWIYEPENSRIRKSIFAKLIEKKYRISLLSEFSDNFSKRVNLLIADNERDKRIVIELAGKRFELPKSLANGHIFSEIEFPSDFFSGTNDSLITFKAITAPTESREFIGECQVLSPVGCSVISDIDDTVKLSGVSSKRELLNNTFYQDFRAVEGMPQLYRQWKSQGRSFHYVSSSPWHLYTPLIEFMTNAGFPWAILSLKAIRFKDKTFFDLFKKGTETKPIAIERILKAYPKRTFILVGDSGEQDAEVYADIMRRYPHQIEQVLIRNVLEAPADVLFYKKLFSEFDQNKWRIFDAPDELIS